MDSYRIALRFRDTTPNIDTIEEHRKILDANGAVWWGWWRKEIEPENKNLFKKLATDPGSLLLVDRSTNRCFAVRYHNAVVAGSGRIDEKLVPQYYRGNIDRVSGWFLLVSIEPIDYIEDIGAKLGSSTLLDLIDERAHRPDSSLDITNCNGKSTLLHLSDLHFGLDYDFLPAGVTPNFGEQKRTLTKCIVEDLKRQGLENDIASVLITGDFTTRGDWSDDTRHQILDEFNLLCSELKIGHAQILAIPGNHDVVRYPSAAGVSPQVLAVRAQTRSEHETHYRLFQQELTKRDALEPLNHNRALALKEVDLTVSLLNSCSVAATEWTEYGFVGTDGLEVIQQAGSRKLRKPTFRLMALHHHLIPVSKVETPSSSGVSLTLNAVELLDAAQAANIAIVLHGHQHLARVASYRHFELGGGGASGKDAITIVSGGSSGASRRPVSERNSYSTLRFSADQVHLTIRELRADAKVGATLIDRSLDVASIS
jgi:hypothetical protein